MSKYVKHVQIFLNMSKHVQTCPKLVPKLLTPFYRNMSKLVQVCPKISKPVLIHLKISELILYCQNKERGRK